MKFLKTLQKIFHIKDIGAEQELWKKENMKEDFLIEFARSNSESAKILLPIASVIFAVILMIAGFVAESIPATALYSVMILLSVISYIVVRILSKDIKKNYKKILVYIDTLACCYMALISFLIIIVNSPTTVIVIFTATITIIIQAILLRPTFAFVFSLCSMLIFGLITIFDTSMASVDYRATIGIVLISSVSFFVSYNRYYNRCRIIYNKKVILSQNKKLDEMVAQLQLQKIELEHTNRNLETAYICDRLTGLYNRWYWDENVDAMAKKCVDGEKNTAIIMIDLDNFKMINDENGHAMGDICLVHVASVLKEAAKNNDNCSVYRMGGEEFVVFCSDIEKGDAFKLANQILKDISNIRIDGFDGMLTASIGLHIEIPNSVEDISRFLIEADNAMYDAKKQGKNRIVLSLP